MPNPALGLTTALATAVESTYGTPLAPDRFLEFESETLERKQEVLSSNALRSGTPRLHRGSRRVTSARWGEGQITCEAVTNGLGRLLNHALGGTSTITQQGVTAAWLQTHSLGSTLGKYLTVQKQFRDEANAVVQQFTFEGTKITDLEMKCAKKGKLMLSFGCDAEDVNVATAAATPAYTATNVFHFAQGALTVGGTAVALVSDFSTKFDRKMATDRFFLGNAGLKKEPLLNDFPEVTGTLTAEFDDKATYFDRFAADTPVALVMTFTGAIISGSFNELFRITIPEIRFTGETPKAGGPGLIMQNASFEGCDDGTNAGIKVEYQSTDLAV